MRSISTTRRYELFIVLAAAAAYIIRRLLELASSFDLNIRMVQNEGVSNATILRDLASFDYNQNVVFPTVAGGVLFMAAWYAFHFHTFPLIREKRYDARTKGFIALSVGLTIGSILLNDFFKKEITARSDANGNTIGFYPFSGFPNPLTSLVAALLCLLIYEAFAQTYYHTVKLYRQDGQSRHRTLQYLLLVLAAFCLILWVFVGSIANFAIGRGGVFVGLAIVALTVVFHYLFYKKLLPFLANYWSIPRSGWYYVSGILLYVLASFLLFLVWRFVAPGSLHYPFLYLYILPGLSYKTIC